MSEIFVDKNCTVCSTYGEFIKKRNNSVEVFNQLDLSQTDISRDELVYIKNDKKFYASNAIIESIADIGGLYKLMKISYLAPKIIRDTIYKIISKNRKRFFYK
jgi:predicted DCC family thiol-disulfide oxidoreductase YuxK|tara:strand:- start:627 stop:935 length:309 start_codon:yes stop_codon:yes gene_type:complete